MLTTYIGKSWRNCVKRQKDLKRLSTTKALLRLFQRTVRLERFAPGLSKSITWRINQTNMGEIWYFETSYRMYKSYLLVVDFEVGGFYYKGCVVFSFFQLVKQVDERPVNTLSQTMWNQTLNYFWDPEPKAMTNKVWCRASPVYEPVILVHGSFSSTSNLL